jgi:hypothetical protein
VLLLLLLLLLALLFLFLLFFFTVVVFELLFLRVDDGEVARPGGDGMAILSW